MTLTDLKVDGIEYSRLKSFSVTEKANVHATCEMSLVMPTNFDAEKLLQFDKTKVTVKAEDAIIFCGLVNRCRLEIRVDGKILSVTLRSLSCQTESARRSKSYQSPKKKCSDVLNDVAKNYEAAQFDCWKDDTIGALIYRDDLTDWDFLKDLAARHGQILFVDSKTDKLRLSVGFKAFGEFKSNDSFKLSRRNVSMDFYKRLEQNTYEGARTCYFAETELTTSDLKIGVGCSVRHENKTQAVISSHIYDNGGTLYNKIILRPVEGCRAAAEAVMNYFDEFFYLTGKTLEAKDNDVKIQFDCDKTQSKDDALNIPCELTASNYLYNMPDDGDKVYVYVDNLRQAALGSLRAKNVSDDYQNRSFKIKGAELIFDPKKFSFVAAEKTELKHEDGTSFNTNKDIIFSAKGDIVIQSAQGLMPDNQLTMIAPHSTGYAMYLAKLGQPATVMFNPAASTVGLVDSQLKTSGAKAEAVELSDLAKELDKLTGRKTKSNDEKKSGSSSGGTIKLDAKKSLLVQVKDSSIEMKGSKLNVKTCALIQVGYIPTAGGGTGSLSKFAGGNPGNRSDKINVEHGTEDRARVKESVSPTPDTKTISR